MNPSDYVVSGPNSLSIRMGDKRIVNRTILKPGDVIPDRARLAPERLKLLLAEGAIHRRGDSSPQRRMQVEAPTLPAALEPSEMSSQTDGSALNELAHEQEKVNEEQQDAKGERRVFPGVDLGASDVEVDRKEE